MFKKGIFEIHRTVSLYCAILTRPSYIDKFDFLYMKYAYVQGKKKYSLLSLFKLLQLKNVFLLVREDSKALKKVLGQSISYL